MGDNKLTILLTKVNNGKHDIVTVLPDLEELELDLQRQDFESAWQSAMTKEDLANAILFGMHFPWDHSLNYGSYDIRNQARDSLPPV